MPGNPTEYRERALRCIELAAAARTKRLTATFLNLAESWQALARNLEGNKGIVDGDGAFRKRGRLSLGR
jgi:hypothetical protein